MLEYRATGRPARSQRKQATHPLPGAMAVFVISTENPVKRRSVPNISLGDTVAAIHAALGVAFAIIERNNSGKGQVVDVALYESIFNLLEGIVPEFDGAGVVRGPSGTTITGIVPTNTYLCADNKHVVIGGNSDSISTLDD